MDMKLSLWTEYESTQSIYSAVASTGYLSRASYESSLLNNS